MAEYILKNFDFKKILFIPAFVPPQKEIFPQLAAHRYKMVELAIKNNPYEMQGLSKNKFFSF